MSKLFDEIKAVHGNTLGRELARQQEERKAQLKAKGISVLGDAILERRDFVTGSNIQDLMVEGFAARPHRLVVTNRISRDFDKQVEGLKAGILEEYLHKSEGKVINTMLSTYTASTDPTDSTPAPIFSTYTGVSSIDDIVGYTSQLKGSNIWVISPSAVADILALYGADALNSSKLMGYPFIIEENAESGFFYFGDFSKFYVADFELYPFTFDDVTRAHLNETQVTAESFWDYKLMGGTICKFKYEPTDPTEPTE